MNCAGREVKRRLQAEGMSIAEWSRKHGFSQKLVYCVLDGSVQRLRGQAHQIAVAIGLKEAPRSNPASSGSRR